MSTEAKTRAGPYADIAPALNAYTQDILFGRVWEGSALPAFYTGWPNANTAVEVARKVFAEVA